MVSMVFYTPEETIMKVAEAQERGYRIGNIGSRLVIRSSQTAPETYSKDVSGMSFRVDLNHVWYYTWYCTGGRTTLKLLQDHLLPAYTLTVIWITGKYPTMF